MRPQARPAGTQEWVGPNDDACPHHHTLTVRRVVQVATLLEPGRPRLARRLRRFEGACSGAAWAAEDEEDPH